jgi:hypothetical protein
MGDEILIRRGLVKRAFAGTERNETLVSSSGRYSILKIKRNRHAVKPRLKVG